MQLPLYKLAVVALCVLAFATRISGIATNPPELFSDEAINVASARSLVETGKDLEGKSLFYFSDRLELRPPVYGYLAYASTRIFGWNTTAVRLPAVIGGVVAVAMVMTITSSLFSKFAGLFAGLTMALLPWSVHYSRIGWEPAMFLPLCISGIALLIYCVKQERISYFYGAIACFCIAMYAYNSAVFTTTAFLVFGLFWYRAWFVTKKSSTALGLLVYCLAIVPFFTTAVTQPKLLERAQRISTFREGVSAQTISTFVQNYRVHLQTKFLFKEGDPNHRHGGGYGVLYWWMAPMIVIGLFALMRKKKKADFFFLLCWFFFFPLGGSLTNDGVPHATRTLLGAPFFAIATGIGASYLLRKIPTFYFRMILLLVFLAVLAQSASTFLHRYYETYPSYSALWWEYGNAQVFREVRQREQRYSVICLGNLNYWNARSLMAYYGVLKDPRYVERRDDRRCLENGSLVVSSIHDPVDGDRIATIYDYDGYPLYVLVATKSTTQTAATVLPKD